VPYRRKKLTFAISSPDEFLHSYAIQSLLPISCEHCGVRRLWIYSDNIETIGPYILRQVFFLSALSSTSFIPNSQNLSGLFYFEYT